MTRASDARVEFLQWRAAAAVERLTGLNVSDAHAVVLHGRRDLYDSERSSGANDGGTLGDDVQGVVADLLDASTAAGAFAVTALLDVVDAPWTAAHGEALELRLPDGRLGLTSTGSWSHLQVPAEDGGVEFWWTGVADACPDALLVADVLQRVSQEGEALAGRRVRDVDLLIPRCTGCGGHVVPLVHGMPDGEIRAAAALGYVRLAGCLVPDEGAGTEPLGECVDCGQQRGLTLEGDRT